MTDLEHITQAILSFRDERDWNQFHNPKDLAISISLEAAELLEAFQWSGTDTSSDGREDKIREELADILIFCVLLANAIDADPVELMEHKLAINGQKYPVDAARGTSRKYTELH